MTRSYSTNTNSWMGSEWEILPFVCEQSETEDLEDIRDGLATMEKIRRGEEDDFSDYGHS